MNGAMIFPNCCQQHVELSKCKTNPSLGSPKCVHVLVDPSNDLAVSDDTSYHNRKCGGKMNWWTMQQNKNT
jgi:hypothetical protein